MTPPAEHAVRAILPDRPSYAPNARPTHSKVLPFRGALPRLILNVPAIARKNLDEVRRVLGAPSTCSTTTTTSHPRYSFKAGAIDIVFVHGRAAWIAIRDTRGLPRNAKGLSRLGLPVTKPTLKEKNRLLRWENIRGVRSVSFYLDGGAAVSHVYIDVGSGDAAAVALK